MGGYIGATAVGLTTTAADVQGDITSTDTTPELILKNTSEEDTEGGREGKITFKGEQSGGEETTLAQIESAHDGTSDDEKGDLIFKTNDGNDGASPTERLRLDSAGDMLLSSPDPSFTITNTTQEDTDGGRESTIVFKGEQSGGELSTLAEIEASHDGTADDEKGDLIFKTNDGSDGASPTEAMRIGSDQRIFLTRGDTLAEISMDANRSSVDQSIGRYQFLWNGTLVAKIEGMAGPDTTNKDDGQLRFQTRESGSAIAERMRIDSSGDVGIGTTSPRAKTEVFDTDVSAVFDANNLSTWRVMQVRNNIESNTGTAAGIALGGDGTGDTDTAGIVGISDNSTGGVCQLGFITSTGNQSHERMRIDSSGNLFVGTGPFNSNVESLNLNTFAVEQSTGRCLISASVQPMELARTSGDTNTRAHIQFFREGVNVGQIQTTGSSTIYGTSSDYRLKENVTDVTNSITRVKQLAPKRFNFIADADITVDGFLAHEVATVVPEAVCGDKDAVQVWAEGEELPDGVSVGDNKLDDNGNTIIDPQGIDQSKLVPLLTSALQEAIAKIETLETKVAALEGA